MGAIPSWGIYCDVCDSLLSNGDLGSTTARAARHEAKLNGAHRSRGRDICEDCWNEGER